MHTANAGKREWRYIHQTSNSANPFTFFSDYVQKPWICFRLLRGDPIRGRLKRGV